MAFALFSKFKTYRLNAMEEFLQIVADLLESEEVQSLDSFVQHHCFTRLRHSLDVAYFSFFITRLFRWDFKSAARGGLLHDLFYYDWREIHTGRQHLVSHPIVALENARNLCELNHVEEDIIRKHMWLITLTPPRYKEAFVVTFVDKYCALREFSIGIFARGRVRTANAHV
ncbi:hydrolase [Oscillospiraceae bacterium MB08-C2-2]|nr:hydrolase [Oscillospiraceae bacterium MB08-C2-2]